MNPGAMEFLPSSAAQAPPTPQRAINPEEDNSSPSTISAHYSKNPELADAPAMVFHQASHASNFKKIDMGGQFPIAEAFPGAADIVRSLNPEYYSMSFGTRVVNGKTEHYQNIHAAVKSGRWSTIENSSKRIMELYDAREGKDDKLVLLFSVNSTQQYCGLAEIVGPWDPEVHVDGWMERTSGAGTVGSFPITLRFIKNVPFTLFNHIKQDRNGHSVLNMWDGMRFDSEAGREVVKAFVEQAHFTNLLAWPSDGRGVRIPAGCPYQWQVAGPFGGPKHIQDSKERKERDGINNTRTTRGGFAGRGRGDTSTPRGGMGRGTGMALASANWRDRGNQLPAIDTNKAQQHRDLTVVRHVPTSAQLGTKLAQMQLDGAVDKPEQPKYFSCIKDQNGVYIPVPAGIPDTILCVRDSNGGLEPLQVALAKPDSLIKMQSCDLSKSYAHALQHAAPMNALSPGALKSADVFTDHSSNAAPVGNAPGAMRNTASANAMLSRTSHRNSPALAGPLAVPASAGIVGNRASGRVLKAQRSALPAGFVFGDHTDSADPGFFREHGGVSGVEMPLHKPTVTYTGDVDATPTHRISDAKSQTVNEKMDKWLQNTPTTYEGAEVVQRPAMPTPLTAMRPSISIADSLKHATAIEASEFGDQIPVHKRGVFFGLMAEKARYKKNLANMSEEEEEEYFRVKMQANEINTLLDRLIIGEDIDEDELAALKATGSPARADTLEPEDSIGNGSDRPFKNKPLSDWSWDTNVKRNIDSLVNSAPGSEVVMKGRGNQTRFVSNPYAVLEDEVEGGARLE